MSNQDGVFHFYGYKTFENHKGVDEQRRVAFTGLLSEDEREIKVGMAACSLSDQYRRAKGRSISTHRAEHRPVQTLTLIPFTEDNEDSIPRKQFIAWCNDYCD